MIQITRWKCCHPACTRAAQGLGSARALRVLGWHVATTPNSDKWTIRCPAHHPKGPRAAAEEASKLATLAGIAASIGDIVDGAGAVVDTVTAWIPDLGGDQ
jgi:hypothetical protein